MPARVQLSWLPRESRSGATGKSARAGLNQSAFQPAHVSSFGLPGGLTGGLPAHKGAYGPLGGQSDSR